MEVSLLNVRITFQKNGVAVDGIGNHKNTWADYYSCHATAGGEAGKQTSETRWIPTAGWKLSGAIRKSRNWTKPFSLNW